MKRVSGIGLAVLALTLVCLFPSLRTDSALRNRLVVTAVGFDRRDATYTVTVQGVEPLKTAAGLSEQQESATAVHEAAAPSVAGAVYALTERAGRRPFWRQNGLLVLSEACCRDTDLADGESTQLDLAVAVCRGETRPLLEMTSGNDAIPARDVVRMLKEGGQSGQCLYRTFLDVERARSGMWDSVLPILDVQNGHPVYDGTALFRGGRLVGTLDNAHTAVLALLLGETSQIAFTFEDVLYTLTQLKTRLTIQRDGEVFRYRFAVTGQVTASADETAALCAALERTATELLHTLDTLSCDPLALARQTAVRYPSQTQKTVSSQLSRCEKTVTVSLRF